MTEKGNIGRRNNSREVVGVEVNEGSIYDDCTSIESIEYEWGGNVISLPPEKIHQKIVSGQYFYVEHDGEKHELKACQMGSRKYVRAAEEDTPEDPLLKLKDESQEDEKQKESEGNTGGFTDDGIKMRNSDFTDDENDIKAEYSEIAQRISEVVEAKQGLVGKIFGSSPDFFEVLSRKFEDIEGIRVEGKRVIVRKIDSSVWSETEFVFHAFYESIEECVNTSMRRIIKDLKRRLKNVRGGEKFLNMVDFKGSKVVTA